jgi:hypothetical protein
MFVRRWNERKAAAMSEQEKRHGPLWPLDVVYRRTYSELRGEHGGRGRTAFARVAVLSAVLLFGGSMLATALGKAWPAIVVLVAVVVVVRLARRWLRRW